MPVSKKRKKKREKKPAGPPPSKTVIAAKKRKLTKRQILIYVFSALIILSFALSFVVGSGGGTSSHSGQSGAPDVSDTSGEILFTPVPDEDSQADEGVEPGQNMSSESDTEN